MPEFPRAQRYLGKLLETSLGESTGARLTELRKLWDALTPAEQASVRDSLRQVRKIELDRDRETALSLVAQHARPDSREQREVRRGAAKLGLSTPLADFVAPRYRSRR